jgi:hypothetical protein
MQVSTRGGEVRLSHGTAETRLTGDPLVWVLRGEPRVIEEELPHTVWPPAYPALGRRGVSLGARVQCRAFGAWSRLYRAKTLSSGYEQGVWGWFMRLVGIR